MTVAGLTDTQRRNAEILASQGDTPEAIAKHIGGDLADVKKALPQKRTREQQTPNV